MKKMQESQVTPWFLAPANELGAVTKRQNKQGRQDKWVCMKGTDDECGFRYLEFKMSKYI